MSKSEWYGLTRNDQRNNVLYIRVIDNAGNVSNIESAIMKIDRTKPTVSLGTNGGNYVKPTSGNATIKTTIIAQDTGGSGLKTLQYAWSTSDTTEPETWTTFTSGNIVSKNDITGAGTYYLWTNVIDNAGNRADTIKVSNAFVVNANTGATGKITITPNTTNWTNKDVIGTVTYGSALTTNKKAGYGATLEAAKTAASTNTATSLTAPQNGYFYAEATDSMGNKVVTSLQISNIDKINPTITNDTLAGTMLFNDPTFANGTNSVVVYNNKNNGAVTITRKAMPDSPTGSGYGLEIKTTGESFPQHGGFTFTQRVADNTMLNGLLVYMNKIYIFKIIAKIPVGYQIHHSTNSIGDNGTMTWKTSQQGTGEWEEYIGIVKCGDTGKMQTTLYFGITGGQTATPENPLVWQVAYATVFDTSEWGTGESIFIEANEKESDIVSYGIATASTEVPTFKPTEVTKTLYQISDKYTENRTYYVHVKDKAGNTASKVVVMGYIDITPPVLQLSSSGTTITITNDVPNLYANYTPRMQGNDDNGNIVPPTGIIEDVTGTTALRTIPIATAKTWKLQKNAQQHQWFGFQDRFGSTFTLKEGDYLSISGYVNSWYSNSFEAGTNRLWVGRTINSWDEWDGYNNTTYLYKEDRITGGGNGWSMFYSTEKMNKAVTNGIIVAGPFWQYSKEVGSIYLNGLSWRVIPASNTTAEDILVRKYAAGTQTVSYFQNGGGTIFNDNKFTVTSKGTYTVYVEDKAGNGTAKTITVN